MYRIEKWNATRRPGKASDGPPYGKPGMWSPFSQEYATEAEANEALEKLLTPMAGEGARDPKLYRVHRQVAVKAIRRKPGTRTRQKLAA